MIYGESVIGKEIDQDYNYIVAGIVVTLEESFQELYNEFMIFLKDPLTEKSWNEIRIREINSFEDKGMDVLDNLINSVRDEKPTVHELDEFRKLIKSRIVDRYNLYKQTIIEYLNTLSLDGSINKKLIEVLTQFELSLTSFIDNISFEKFEDFLKDSEKRVKKVCSSQILKVLSN